MELVGDPLAHGAREFDAIVHRDARDRDERKDIERSDPRMFPAVRVHVNPLDRDRGPAKRRLGNRFPVANKRDHRTVVIRVHLHVEHADSGGGGDCRGDFFHDVRPAALGEIRNALDDLGHCGLPERVTNVRIP